MRPTIAYINIDAMAHNLDQVYKLYPNKKLFAVIKADAYGHGISSAVKAFEKAPGFAVATIEEAIAVRKLSHKPILVLSAFCQRDEVALLAQHQLMPVVHSMYQLDYLLESPKAGSIDVWLKFESGMNRLGLKAVDLDQAITKITSSSHLKVQGIMTHLASADDINSDLTEKQIVRFFDALKKYNIATSIQNSAGILACPKINADYLRPGLMLYGSQPVQSMHQQKIQLKPVMSFKSALIAIKTIQPGEGVGYDHNFIVDKEMTIGIVACGYGDGYPRHARTGTPIMINNTLTRTVGRVSMDTLALDLSDMNNVKIGDCVELWGDHLSIDEVAKVVGSIAYELMTRVSPRVPRVAISTSN